MESPSKKYLEIIVAIATPNTAVYSPYCNSQKIAIKLRTMFKTVEVRINFINSNDLPLAIKYEE